MSVLLDPAALAQVLTGGILLGGIYALVAVGLNLIFGVLKVINIAHGEFMMLGAYVTYFLFTRYDLPPLLSLAASMPATFALGWLLQRFVVRRVMGGPELMTLLVTFGVSILITNLALELWSADFRSVPYYAGALRLLGVALSRARLVAFVSALVLTGAVWWFLKRTHIGKAIRATAQHPEVALTCGIDIERVRLITFALGSALAGAAGSLLIPMFSVDPTMGHRFILKAFAVCVIGGLGSFQGALAGGLVLGVAENLVAFAATSQHAGAVAYLLLIGVLLFRPAGLLGVKA